MEIRAAGADSGGNAGATRRRLSWWEAPFSRVIARRRLDVVVLDDLPAVDTLACPVAQIADPPAKGAPAVALASHPCHPSRSTIRRTGRLLTPSMHVGWHQDAYHPLVVTLTSPSVSHDESDGARLRDAADCDVQHDAIPLC
jgi:hypothetical protein